MVRTCCKLMKEEEATKGSKDRVGCASTVNSLSIRTLPHPGVRKPLSCDAKSHFPEAHFWTALAHTLRSPVSAADAASALECKMLRGRWMYGRLRAHRLQLNSWLSLLLITGLLNFLYSFFQRLVLSYRFKKRHGILSCLFYRVWEFHATSLGYVHSFSQLLPDPLILQVLCPPFSPPTKCNLCGPWIYGCVIFHWSTVDLPIGCSLKEMDSHLPAASSCQAPPVGVGLHGRAPSPCCLLWLEDVPWAFPSCHCHCEPLCAATTQEP